MKEKKLCLLQNLWNRTSGHNFLAFGVSIFFRSDRPFERVPQDLFAVWSPQRTNFIKMGSIWCTLTPFCRNIRRDFRILFMMIALMESIFQLREETGLIKRHRCGISNYKRGLKKSPLFTSNFLERVQKEILVTNEKLGLSRIF